MKMEAGWRLRRNIGYLLLGASLIYFILGIALPPRLRIHPRSLGALRSLSAWQNRGFRVGLTAEHSGPPASGVGVFSVDKAGATLRTPWIPVDRRFVLWFSGFPNAPGNVVLVTIRQEHGADIPARIELNPGNSWEVWTPIVAPPGKLQVQIYAHADSSTGASWFAFSEPFVPETENGLSEVFRNLLAICASISLVFGPGLVWKAWRQKGMPLGLVGVPGFFVLSGVGLLTWVMPHAVPLALLTLVLVVPILVFCAWGLHRTVPLSTLTTAEAKVLLLAVVLVIVGAAKAAYSRGPPDELFASRASRSLESGDRSDSRIPYMQVQLIDLHERPHSPVANSIYAPYTFSDRGPLPGMAAAALVNGAGAELSKQPPDDPWTVFDPEGFAASRILLMTLAALALPAVFSLGESLGGEGSGLVAAVMAAGAPFVLHETYFTWPKLLASAFVLIGLRFVWERRPLLGGFAIGVGYWCHPGALMMLPVAGTLWLLRTVEDVGGCNSKAAWRRAFSRSDLYRGGALTLLGVGLWMVAWRIVNRHHFHQDNFWRYATLAYGHHAISFAEWFRMRKESFVNTVVPLAAYFATPKLFVPSRGWNKFFFEYWLNLPFAFGILGLPVMVMNMARGFWRRPLQWLLLVTVPLLIFSAYWGATDAGMMREGLHAWFLFLCVMLALEERSGVTRLGTLFVALLAVRGVETMLMMIVPTWLPGAPPPLMGNEAIDVGCVLVMAIGLGWIGRETWRALIFNGDEAKLEARSVSPLELRGM